VSRRAVRLVVVPAILFAVVAGGVYALAEWHPAKPEAASTGPVSTGDSARGAVIYAETCSSCHGEQGRNARVGPDLAGNPISLAGARAQIQNGGSAMPADLVRGQDLDDVLAYLETILAGEPLRED
jgi:mono/diheme cytochrome c family protein